MNWERKDKDEKTTMKAIAISIIIENATGEEKEETILDLVSKMATKNELVDIMSHMAKDAIVVPAIMSAFRKEIAEGTKTDAEVKAFFKKIADECVKIENKHISIIEKIKKERNCGNN